VKIGELKIVNEEEIESVREKRENEMREKEQEIEIMRQGKAQMEE